MPIAWPSPSGVTRRNRRLTPGHWRRIEPYLAQGWSPEQIAGRWQVRGRRWISHEAIRRYLARDRSGGGRLYRWPPQGLSLEPSIRGERRPTTHIERKRHYREHRTAD